MNDIERKVFRIIFNKTLSHEPVTLKQLNFKTGRTEKELRQIVKSLIIQKRIKWDKEKQKWIVYTDDGLFFYEIFVLNYLANIFKIVAIKKFRDVVSPRGLLVNTKKVFD